VLSFTGEVIKFISFALLFGCMGQFASIRVSNEIDLPHFPTEVDRNEMGWQSKQGLDVYGGPYRITSDARLEQEQITRREKTDEEKQREAEKWGFDSWSEYREAYENHNLGSEDAGLYPPEVDYNPDESKSDDDRPPVFSVSKKTVDEVWWSDMSFHGTFEFHDILRRDPISYEAFTDDSGNVIHEKPEEYALDVYLQYEARFTRGTLDKIVFIGERMTDLDDPQEAALKKIEEWKEWKKENN